MASPSSVPPSASHLFRVFIDSSLDTHLTMDISSSDTVAALKRMIETEHPVCFPDIGQITVRSVKVNRSGQLYNMVNPMLIISPFEKVQRPIFLQIEVEAAQAPQQIPNDQNLANNQNEANVVLERGDLVVSDFPSLERGGSMDFSPNLPHAQETLTDPNPMERLQNEKDGANPVETDANPIEKLQNEKDNTNPVEADALAKLGAQTTSNTKRNEEDTEKNPVEKKKSKTTEASSDKNHLVTESNEAEKTIPDMNIGAETQEKVNQERAINGNPTVELNQEVGTGTGAVPMKVKPKKGASKKSQSSQETTHKSEGKKSKKEKVSEAPQIIVSETEFNVGSDNLVLERDCENPGDRSSLSPNEIITDKNTESPKKAPTDRTFTSQAHVSPYKTRSKKAKAVTADVAANNDDVAADKDADKDAGQMISSILADLKDQGPPAPENQADGNIESQTLANPDVATDHPNPNPEPKTRPKLEIQSIQRNESSQNITPNENKKYKKVKIFAAPLLGGNENTQNPENFETLAVVSSQQASERIGTKLDSNSNEDSSKQDKKKKRWKTEAMVHNLNTDEINFIDYFSPDEPKKRLKDPNPSLVGDMAYLSDDNTKDENDAKHAVKRHKVAVRKVPVKRKTGEKNKSDASRESLAVSNDEVFDGSAKMKKGGEGKSKTGKGSQSVDIVYETEGQDVPL